MQINHSGTRFPRVREIPKASSKTAEGPVRPTSFKGLPRGMCIGGGGFAPLNSRDRAKGKCDSLPQNMREEGEGGKERPQRAGSKGKVRDPFPYHLRCARTLSIKIPRRSKNPIAPALQSWREKRCPPRSI